MSFQTPGEKEDPEVKLIPDRVVLCKAIGTPSGDQVDDPSKKPRRSDPRKAGQDKPNYANDNSSVIDLSEPGNQ